MSVSSVDVLRNSFGILKSSTGQKLVGIFFVIQLLNYASSYLMEEMSMISAGATISILGGLLGVVATIGGLRSLREEEVKLEHFRENLVWPFGRIAGANLITGILAYMVAFIFLGPALLAAATSGITSLAGLTSASAGVLALAGIGGLLGLGALIYVSVMLILAQPFIAIDDRRMFEALDKSIQDTKGSRLNILMSLIGYFLIYMGATILFGLATLAAPEFVVSALITVVLGPVLAPVMLKILEEFSRELG